MSRDRGDQLALTDPGGSDRRPAERLAVVVPAPREPEPELARPLDVWRISGTPVAREHDDQHHDDRHQDDEFDRERG